MNPFTFPYAKAVWATVVAFLGALGTAVMDETGVTLAEWVTIASATVIAAGAIFGVTGTEPRKGDPATNTSTGRRRKRGTPGGEVVAG